MTNKDLLIGAIETLTYSWGSDTPQEVYWGLTELITFLNAEYNVCIPPLIPDGEGNAIEYLIEDIKRLL